MAASRCRGVSRSTVSTTLPTRDGAILDLKAEHAAFVVCISEFTGCDQLRLVAAEGDWGKYHVVKCGIDLDRFDFAGDPAIAGAPRVLTVARLSPEKGHVVLIQAARRLADRGRPVQLRVRRLRALPRRACGRRRTDAGCRRRAPGELSPSQVRPAPRAADVFCLPSFAEGIPVSIMEAMAVGVPVVASDVGGIAELVHDHSTGRLVPAGDDGRLADALAAAIHDEPVRRPWLPGVR